MQQKILLFLQKMSAHRQITEYPDSVHINTKSKNKQYISIIYIK